MQLESKTEMEGGLTIAQFLMRYGERYDPKTGRYIVTGSADRCGEYRTVIVDECSMLTEEQLAALLDSLTGVDRLVLVVTRGSCPPSPHAVTARRAVRALRLRHEHPKPPAA